jgi:hypothetical protein
MMILLSLACAGNDIAGTWMFTRTLTPATGDECVTGDVSHNFAGAYTPTPPDVSTDWTTDDQVTYSPEVFFGRIEADQNGMLLLLGSSVLVGTEKSKNDWEFSWTKETNDYGEESHVSGYLYTHSSDSTSTLKVSGTFGKDGFSGSHETDTTSTQRWTESDSWSEDVAATVGTTGQIPVSSVLVRVDGSGNEVPVTNDYQSFDCDDSDCTLSEVASCVYRYDLTAVPTDFSPDDANWVQDAGEAAGNG